LIRSILRNGLCGAIVVLFEALEFHVDI
jgi:hypothetical protein